MYYGSNVKRHRKLSKIEALQTENERLHKALTTLIHLHERLKNERKQVEEVAKLPPLSEGLPNDGKIVKCPRTVVQVGTDNEPTPGTNKEGA